VHAGLRAHTRPRGVNVEAGEEAPPIGMFPGVTDSRVLNPEAEISAEISQDSATRRSRHALWAGLIIGLDMIPCRGPLDRDSGRDGTGLSRPERPMLLKQIGRSRSRQMMILDSDVSEVIRLSASLLGQASG
jgi:hypothetical protein